jgi:hypothetical protein
LEFLEAHQLEYLRGALEVIMEGTPALRVHKQISRLGLSSDIADMLLSALESDTA